MKNFIFYTTGGFTQDNNLKEISNMQILGFANGENINIAYENFKNDYYANNEYNFNTIIGQEILGVPTYL